MQLRSLHSSRKNGVTQKSLFQTCLFTLCGQLPYSDDQANIRNITKIECEQVTPGYSDHTLGIKAAELAVACGARIIEKHFTLNKYHSDFRDHKLSADPNELKALVHAIADVEKFLGKTDNAAAPCEKQNATAVGRSIASNRDIRIGETISIADICCLSSKRLKTRRGKSDHW